MHHMIPFKQTLYNAMLENNCSEHASRMSAMENSTKSAGEMLNSLTLKYNRDRWVSTVLLLQTGCMRVQQRLRGQIVRSAAADWFSAHRLDYPIPL